MLMPEIPLRPIHSEPSSLGIEYFKLLGNSGAPGGLSPCFMGLTSPECQAQEILKDAQGGLVCRLCQ